MRTCALDTNESIGNLSLLTNKGLVIRAFCVECMRNGRAGRYLMELQENDNTSISEGIEPITESALDRQSMRGAGSAISSIFD